MTQPTMLAFPPGTWRGLPVCGSTRYHLFTLAEMGWRVVYVDPVMGARSWRTTRQRVDVGRGHIEVLRLGGVMPFGLRAAPTAGAARAWRALASGLMARAVARALDAPPDVIWLGAPWHGSLARGLPWAGVPRVWHVYDELSESTHFRPFQRQLLREWEAELMEHCALAFCSSMPQLERRRGGPARGVLLENGVPEQFLEPAEGDPPEQFRPLVQRLDSLPRPVIAYGGVVDNRLDHQLFRELLDGLEQGAVAFLGHLDPRLDPAFRRLIESHPRAHLFGAIPHRAYPWLYRRCTALLLAHRITPFTDAMLSEKLVEYLATGMPIISVPLSEVLRLDRELSDGEGIFKVATATELLEIFRGDDWLHAVSPSKARRDVARRRTWKQLGAQLERELACLIGGPFPSP